MPWRITSEWRGVVRSLVLSATVATAWAAEGPEAKSKITFSDTKGSEVRVDVGGPTPTALRNADVPRRGGSSLDGMGATPFAPVPTLLPGVVSRREREGRDARNNWILDPGKDLTMSEENVNRAFGVRSGDFDRTGKESDRPSNFWEAYFKKTSEAGPTAQVGVFEPSVKERSGLDPLRRFQNPGMAEFDAGLLPSTDRQRSGVLFSDTSSRTPALGTLGDTLHDSRRDLVRESLSFTPVSPTAKPETGAAARAEQFRRLLGIESPGRPNSTTPPATRAGPLAEAGPAQDPLGSMDFIGVAPDPTRRELNPVVARPAPDFGGSSKLNFSDSIGGLILHPAAQRRPLVDMGPMRSLPSAITSVEASPGNAARRTTYSPTALEIPRRSF